MLKQEDSRIRLNDDERGTIVAALSVMIDAHFGTEAQRAIAWDLRARLRTGGHRKQSYPRR